MDPVISPEPIQPEIPPKSRFSFLKSAKVWPIVVLLALLIPATGYFLSKNQTKPTSTVQTSPTPTTDPTVNWKIYKTDIFEVKYPSDWYLNKADSKSLYPTTDRLRNYDINIYNDAIIKQKKNTPDGFSDLFSIDFQTHSDVIKSKPTNVALLDFVKANVIDPTSKNFEEITVYRLPAVKVTTKKGTVTNLLNFDLETHILKTDRVYVVAGFIEHPIFTQDGITGFQRIYDQILSTFKFTDQSAAYSCPAPGNIDCMPTVSPNGQTPLDPHCQYSQWVKTNCQGVTFTY